ncbi:MAG: hypothetical protein KDA98_08740 [Acidimicrobiales bacterium]|nr:hypothetical protein [Acidimicrobiales bacterium]
MTARPHDDPPLEQSGVPNDNDTLIGVLRRLRRDGFTEDLRPVDADGTVRCGGCGMTSPAGELAGVRQRRLEGASDPADMSIVITARCPACERKGILLLGYGPNANESDVAVLQALPTIGDEPTASRPSDDEASS